MGLEKYIYKFSNILVTLLSLSPSKSEAMIFTRQRKYGTIINHAQQQIVAGKPIEYKPKTVRYLGIWLDQKLNWNHHIRIKID